MVKLCISNPHNAVILQTEYKETLNNRLSKHYSIKTVLSITFFFECQKHTFFFHFQLQSAYFQYLLTNNVWYLRY